jgi:hypothetical protein
LILASCVAQGHVAETTNHDTMDFSQVITNLISGSLNNEIFSMFSGQWEVQHLSTDALWI